MTIKKLIPKPFRGSKSPLIRQFLEFYNTLVHFSQHSCVLTRETREGLPLLTVETEINGDSKSTNERGPSLVGSLGLSCGY